jgi:hypothetical protein
MIFEVEVRDELAAAVAWYEDQREGLGLELRLSRVVRTT